MPTERRLAFRFTADDLHHLAVIATGLRAAGDTFANRTDALRHALTLAAAAVIAAPLVAPETTNAPRLS